MIKIKPLEEKFKNADTETKNQLRNLAIEEALKQCVSEEDLRIELSKFPLKEKLNKTLQGLEERIKSLEKKIKILIR